MHTPTQLVGTWLLTPVHCANDIHNGPVCQEIVHFNIGSTVEQQGKQWVRGGGSGEGRDRGGEGGEEGGRESGEGGGKGRRGRACTYYSLNLAVKPGPTK